MLNVIDEFKQVMGLRKKALSKGMHVFIYQLVIGLTRTGEDGKPERYNEAFVTRQDENEQIRQSVNGLFHVDRKDRVVRNFNGTKTVKNFSRSVLTVRIINKKQTNMYLSRLFVWHKAAKTEFYVQAGKMATNILTGEEVSVDTLLSNKKIRVYVPDLDSTSKLRKRQVDFIDVTDGIDKAEALFSAITCGGYDLFKGHIVEAEAGSKNYSRCTLSMAPSKFAGHIKNYLIFMGKFKYKGNEFLDGEAFYRDAFAAYCFTRLLGMPVGSKAVLGLPMQARFFGYMAKVFGSVQDSEFFELLLKQFEVIHVPVMTPELCGMIANKDPRIMGKAIWVGDDLPDVAVDLNGLKAPVDFMQEQTFNILDIAKESDAHTSGQMLQKLIPFKDRLTALIRRLAIDDFDKTFKYFKEGKAKVPSLAAIENGNAYLTGIVGDIAPDYLKADKNLFKEFMENTVKGMMKNFNRLHFRIAGTFSRLMCDVAPLFGAEPVLRYGEVFMPHAAAANARKVTLIKYPSVGTGEFYLAVPVSLDDIIARVGKMTHLTAETRRVIINWYRNVRNSICVVPAVELLKKQLAGMDFDYDGVTAIYDDEFNSIMEDIEPLIVSIKTPKGVQKTLGSFGIELFPKILKQQFNAGSLSIGRITLSDDTIIALMSCSFELGAKVLSEVFGNSPVDIYKSPLFYRAKRIDGFRVPYVEISADKMNNIISQIQTCKLDAVSVPQILKDLNVIFRLLQETTIDAAKTGIAIPFEFDVTKTALPNLRRQADAVWDWTKKTCEIKYRFSNEDLDDEEGDAE